MIEGVDIQAGYTLMVGLALLLGLTFPVTGDMRSREQKRQYWLLQLWTLCWALIGAKFAVLMGDALWPLQPFHNWMELMLSGRSIVGALLFGFLAAEIAKPMIGYQQPPNDRFAMLLPFTIGIGRIGCILAGCCRGLEYDGPLAITYEDHIPRHPAALYEFVFHLLIGLALIALWRRRLFVGRLFALYLAVYGAFRFGSEFWRETQKAFAGLSAYQWMSLAMVLAGLVTLVLRRPQPEAAPTQAQPA